MNILASSDRLTGSHIFYCLVINFIGSFELILVIRIEPSDFFSKFLDLSNGPLSLNAFVAIDDLLELLISVTHPVLVLPAVG